MEIASVCTRGDTKHTIHYLDEKTFHATVISHIIVQPGRRSYYYDEDANIECAIVVRIVYVCVCACCIEIAGCHAVSHPMISDINCRRGPALSPSDSRRPYCIINISLFLLSRLGVSTGLLLFCLPPLSQF